jgi:serine/threonine protein kinase
MIEMLENKPPYNSLLSPTTYSDDFHDFVGKCLTARPESRLQAVELLKVSLCCLSISFIQRGLKKRYLMIDIFCFVVLASISFEGS